MKEPNDDFPKEMWVRKQGYYDMNDVVSSTKIKGYDVHFIRAGTVNEYKKGYDDGYEDGVRVEHKRGIEMRKRRL